MLSPSVLVEFLLSNQGYDFKRSILTESEGENVAFDNHDPMGKGGSFKHPDLETYLNDKSSPKKPKVPFKDFDRTVYEAGDHVVYKSKKGVVTDSYRANDSSDAPLLYTIDFGTRPPTKEENVKGDDLTPIAEYKKIDKQYAHDNGCVELMKKLAPDNNIYADEEKEQSKPGAASYLPPTFQREQYHHCHQLRFNGRGYAIICTCVCI